MHKKFLPVRDSIIPAPKTGSTRRLFRADFMHAFFNLYQYIVPALLFPVSYLLWLHRLQGQHSIVLLVLSMPILTGYIIPAIGTNWLKLWEFNTHLRLGRFRPHHGFVLGTAVSLLAFLCIDPAPTSAHPFDLVRAGFIMGSVLAFWNWLYDIYAIKAGFIIMYNCPYFQGRGPEAIATDYAPVYFGTLGLCYGILLQLTHYYLLVEEQWALFTPLLLGGNLIMLTLPVLMYMLWSYLRTGTSGLKPYRGTIPQ